MRDARNDTVAKIQRHSPDRTRATPHRARPARSVNPVRLASPHAPPRPPLRPRVLVRPRPPRLAADGGRPRARPSGRRRPRLAGAHPGRPPPPRPGRAAAAGAGRLAVARLRLVRPPLLDGGGGGAAGDGGGHGGGAETAHPAERAGGMAGRRALREGGDAHGRAGRPGLRAGRHQGDAPTGRPLIHPAPKPRQGPGCGATMAADMAAGLKQLIRRNACEDCWPSSPLRLRRCRWGVGGGAHCETHELASFEMIARRCHSPERIC